MTPLKNGFAEQAEGLFDGGVDLFIVETCQDVLQIKAALNGIEETFAKKGDRRPIMVSSNYGIFWHYVSRFGN